jgi:hypothetical protein
MFDGYHKWLGIPKDQRPPTHYQLLGIAPGEQDADVIEAAAVRQTAFVRNFQGGQHAEECARILTELAEARLTLLNPAKRARYDASLAPAAPAAPESDRGPVGGDDSLAGLEPVLSGVPSESALGLAEGSGRTRRPKPRARSPLTFAWQAVITIATLAAGYALLQSYGRRPASPAGAPQSPYRTRVVVTPVVARPSPKAAAPRPAPPTPSVERPAPVAVASAATPAVAPQPAAPRQSATAPPRPAVKVVTEELRRFEGKVVRIAAVAMMPDGRRAFSAGEDGQIRVYDTENGRIVRHIKAHRLPALALAVSPDGRLLVSGGQDSAVRLWEISTGHAAANHGGCVPPVQAVAFVPRRNQVCAGDASALWLWSTVGVRQQRQFAAKPKKPILGLAIAPDGTRAYALQSDRILEYELTAETQGMPLNPGLTDAGLTALDVAPDGRTVIVGCDDGTLRLWDAEEDTEIRRFEKHTGRVNSVAFSSSGRLVASSGAGDDPTIRLWDVSTGAEIARFSGHTDSVTRAVFAPGDQRLLSGSLDRTVRLWDIPR